MFRSICLSACAVALVSSASAQDPTRLHRIEGIAPIHAGTYYAATGQFVPATGTQTSSFQAGTSDVIYNNNHYTAVFYDINDDTLVVDEGRVPSLTSPATASPVSVTGTSNSYRITDIQFAYATDSIGQGSARVGLYNQYDTCTAPLANGAPILDLIVTGLPGTIQAGSVTPYTFDIDMTGFNFCMLADGDGKYDDEFSDRFGWALLLSADPGSVIGPIVGARPGPFAPIGNGTTFQNAGAASGTGLSTVDQWYDVDPINGTNCLNEGGYDPLDSDPAFGSFWFVLGADLSFSCASCATRIDDNFEENDDCASATVLAAPGSYPGLVVEEEGVDPDYYRITVPPGMRLDATAAFLNFVSDIDLRLYNDDCTIQFDSSTSVSDIEMVTYHNCSASPVDLTLRAYVFGNTGMGCGAYDLLLELDPLCTLADDGLEDNDSCIETFPIAEGFTPNLRVSACDLDYYSITLDNGEQLDITMTLDETVSDLDLFLFLDDVSCDTNPGVLTASTLVASPVEMITWQNTTGQTQTYVLRIDYYVPLSTAGCAAYDLNFDLSGGTVFGDKFCSAEINSTGQGAHIFATGNDTVLANAFILNAEFLPSFSNGYFITSMGQVFVANPGGSQGNLCIAGAPVGRFNNDVQNTGAGSTVAFQPDFNMWPQPTGFITVLMGDEWNFQYWYRDANPGAVSNFTDAVKVTFN